MPTREQIDSVFKAMDESILLMDGFDEAYIGHTQPMNQPILAVYSYNKMVETLMFRDGMNYDDAAEYIEFNCIGAYIGEQTPIIVFDVDGTYFA
jgi:hypothetical protein